MRQSSLRWDLDFPLLKHKFDLGGRPKKITDFFFTSKVEMTRIQRNTWQSLRTGTRDYLYIKQHILSGSRSGHVMARWGKSSYVTWTLTKSKTLTRPGQSKNNNNNNNDNKLNKKKQIDLALPIPPRLTYSKLFYKQNHSILTLSTLTLPAVSWPDHKRP